MRKAFSLLLSMASVAVATIAASSGGVEADGLHVGDGNTHAGRLPWLAGPSNQLSMRQGWGGDGTSHFPGNRDQYGVDWAGAGAFDIHAAAEGDAQCVAGGGFGNVVQLARTSNADPLVQEWDIYAHLPDSECFVGTKHFEQGDLLGESGCTGSCGGNHLHYEMQKGDFTPSDPFPHQSETFKLSGITNFCGGKTWFCGGDPTADNDMYESDNAGPGAGVTVDLGAFAIWLRYTDLGHSLGSGSAWNGLGSSVNWFDLQFKAVAKTYHTQTEFWWDYGWAQDFVSPGGDWTAFHWPGACTAPHQAYHLSEAFYPVWGQNSDELGYARSEIFFDDGPSGPGVYQVYRGGYLYSKAGETPSVHTGRNNTTCWPTDGTTPYGYS